MLFNYTAIGESGAESKGSIDALNMDVALSSLQRRGLVVSAIDPADGSGSILNYRFKFFERVSNREIVILSRQVATLFQAQVSALRIFRMLSEEAPTPILKEKLGEVANDIQGGSTISDALAKHPKVFSAFYTNMVIAGEESGKLDETFEFLAGYLDRTYEVSKKATNALIYPAFVMSTFFGVMILMLTTVIPQFATILSDSGQEIPVYTKVVIALSNFFVNYGVFLLILIFVGGFFVWRYVRGSKGSLGISRLRLSIPFVGDLYRKLFLSRIADNLSTMLSSGIQMVRSIEITAAIVGDPTFEAILKEATEKIKQGTPVSEAFGEYEEFPGILVQMIKIGEETGQLGSILETLAKFYRREVTNAVDTLVNLIEPIMIVALGLGVGVLLASVLLPIYNVAGSI
ncbi:MAG: type II secretion system F family protein [Parcubacteria group bacterium]|nr:type II secretion system F family protein [Parcubacteria group bacterium]